MNLRFLKKMRPVAGLIMLTCMLNAFSAQAAQIQRPFEVNGINYYITDEEAHTVSVDKTNYSGLLNIPATISHEGETYTVTGIEHDAFWAQTGLTSVVIPKTIETIGYKAFRGCSNLKTIAFSSAGNLSSIGYQAFAACPLLTSLNLPQSVKTIGNHAFEDCKGLTALNLGQVEILETATFKGCANLVEVKIPDSTKSIGEMCFWGCDKLRYLTLGSSVEYIGPDAFLQCKLLEDFTLPESLKEIGYEAFRGCFALEHMAIPDNVTTMGYGAFRWCVSLKSIKLGESLETIPNLAFEQTDLESVTIPASVKTIGMKAFNECLKLEELKFGNGDGKDMSLIRIFDEAFQMCSALKSVELPEPLISIGGYAFYMCDNLEFVSLPRTLNSFSEGAFAKCPKLENVYDYAPVPQGIPVKVGTNPFYMSGPNQRVNVHIYENLYDLYSTTFGWYDIPAESYYSYINIVPDIPVRDVESISFYESPIHCGIGEEMRAALKVYPADASATDLLWTSSDESVLFVDFYTGVMIGLQEGESILSVCVTDKPEIKASVKVIVSEDAGVDGITISTQDAMIFDIHGRRLNELQKGINIVNGKKVIVK